MSLPWVITISVVVFAEKVLPRGWWTARAVGVSLVLLALAVALHPELAGTVRWNGMEGGMAGMHGSMSMPMR